MTRFLLDTTVLIDHLRGDEDAAVSLLSILHLGHSLCVSCVGIAEIERGLHPRERRAAEALLDRLEFLPTTREAARRAGCYQADFARKGRTLPVADALVAGTARARGAVLVTDSIADFPMRDIRVVRPAEAPRAQGRSPLTR
ncbi:MAG: PIN domain-containing protein [Acidobacteria bacterium]|nr:PIN domain-containing protein [Acidobacteriota bacterium]